MIKAFILRRLGEASTYRGLLAIAGIFGVCVSPEQADAIIGACVAIYGLMAVFFPDKFGKKKEEPVPEVVTQPTVLVAKAKQELNALGDGEVQPQPKWDGKLPGQFP